MMCHNLYLLRKNNYDIRMQGLALSIKELYKKILFLYGRQTPNNTETLRISGICRDFDVIIGDLNLNPSNHDRMQKLETICGESKFMDLSEKTTELHHQLDHVLIDKYMKPCTFTTSYLIFCSDHNSISLKISGRQCLKG